MTHATIQDWTESQVLLKYDEAREVKYRVYRNQGTVFQEICDVDDTQILAFTHDGIEALREIITDQIDKAD